MSIIDNFCSLRIQISNLNKMRKNQLCRFVLWRHFQDGRHITLFQNRDFIYKYKLHVWPIFYTIFRDKDYDYAIKIWVKGHQTSLNVISRSQYHIKSRILILKLIGPLNTYTLVPWAPLNWKKMQFGKILCNVPFDMSTLIFRWYLLAKLMWLFC